MATEIVLMPDVDSAGDIVEYCIELGDEVSAGDPIVVIESDKASMEVPSSVKGIVTEWLVQMGDSVAKDRPLAKIELLESTSVTAVSVASDKNPDVALVQPVLPVQATPEIPSADMNRPVPMVVGAFYAGPATRKLARELGVELTIVKGSGPRGRILKEDLKEFVKQQMSKVKDSASTGTAIPAFPVEDLSRFGPIETKTLSGIAKATSAHMTRCWLNIPHVTLLDEVDISELEAFRSTIKPDQHGLDKKPTILPFIIMIVAKALRKYPQFNSSLHPDCEQLIYKDYVNIGVAVDTPAGLVVPVIRDADKKSVSELMQEVNELAAKAKARKLKVEDMQGGCFTVSSLGATGGTGFTPIINGPEVAILGVARADMKPVWNGQEFLPRKKLPLCLSFDHRVINGVAAGRFMAMVHQCLSQVGNILL